MPNAVRFGEKNIVFVGQLLSDFSKEDKFLEFYGHSKGANMLPAFISNRSTANSRWKHTKYRSSQTGVITYQRYRIWIAPKKKGESVDSVSRPGAAVRLRGFWRAPLSVLSPSLAWDPLPTATPSIDLYCEELSLQCKARCDTIHAELRTCSNGIPFEMVDVHVSQKPLKRRNTREKFR